MNYLRNAFGAVTQYYQELPPINASTLTGAIDVIVVERPGEDGNLELACSPFHVRFGKWQILRPGEKGVTVMVNGNVIPYQMKIGDAGEAFFVFETDDDVPDELVTSPLLKPTKVGEASGAQEIHNKAGRFGAQESSDDEQGKTSDVSDLEPLPQDNSSLSQEPSYLDLSEQRGHESSSETTASTSETVPSPPTSISTLNSVAADEGAPSQQSGDPDATPVGSSKTSKKDSYNVLSLTPNVAALAKTAIAAGPGLAAEKAHVVGEKLRHFRHRSEVLTSGSKGDQADEQAYLSSGKPPDVVYKDHVVLDMSGYHRSEVPQDGSSSEEDADAKRRPYDRTPSDSTIGGQPLLDRQARRSVGVNVPPHVQADRMTNLDHITIPKEGKVKRDRSASRSSPHRPSLDEISPFHSDTQLQSSLESSTIPSLVLPSTSKHLTRTPSFNRGSSAPPELDGTISQSTPEYSWEWGAFPTASPARRTFPLPDDNSLPRGSSNLRNSISKEGNLDLEEFGSDGTLSTDPKNSSVFCIRIDGKKHAFELSLCGNLLLDDDVEEDMRTFASHKIDREGLLAEPQVVENHNIVMKWNIKLITRRDSPRMVPALKRWAETLKATDTPERPESPSSDPGEFSRPTTPASAPTPNQGRPSTWSRWFRRANRPQSVILTGSPSLEATQSPVSKPAAASLTATPPSPTSISPVESMPPTSKRKFAKTLRLTSDQLKALELKKGANTITFSLSTTGVVACTAKIFVWSHTDHIVVSDIDGTITKSDALGHVFTMIGRDWTHLGVAKLYTDIARNGYKLMYLTSRAIGQADSTRDYLKGIKQNNYQLPEGPVIMSPDRLMASLHREVIMRKPEVFKMACLRDIQRLFGEASRVPFYSGFGNRITDALSYRSVNVPSARIFTIDSTGEVKMELLELAGYKSSYIHMTDLVDQMFPPVHRKWAAEFTDFNYWKEPIQEFDLPDLSPPSPALSAVSDTSGNSRLARLRNFSLGRQASVASVQAATTAVKAVNMFSGRPSAIAYKPQHRHRSTSPLARGDSEAVLDEEASDAEYHARARRRLSNSSSMPGSLPSTGDESHSDYEEGEEEDNGEEEQHSDELEEEEFGGSADGHSLDEVEDHVFDDLVTGQMERVPF